MAESVQLFGWDAWHSRPGYTARMETSRQAVATSAVSTASMPQGLLIAFSNPPTGEEAAFNAWYDDEHAPARLTVPGISSARRYIATAADGPRYMALYDLEQPETLRRPEYLKLNTERSEREKAMLASIPYMDRRVMKTLLGAERWTDDPPYQMTVSMQPEPGAEDDYIAWYREEHIPMLLAVPGWRRIRLYQQVEGNGPGYMAVHELESPAVFESDLYKKATSTPWRDRIVASVTRRERYLFKFLRSFG
jgi:hypothetical protein